MEYHNPEYRTKCRILKGTNSEFMREEKTTLVPLEKESLYLLGCGETKALKILPFIRMSSSPASTNNACYFYSKRDGEDLKFVSYHYAEDNAIKRPFLDTQEAIDSILTLD